MKIAIIGCGAAGATAAQFARKYNRKAEITIYDNEGYGEYSKCALPYIISGELSWKDIIEYPPKWFEKMGMDYKNEEVKRINFDLMEVEGNDAIQYDKIVIATGAKPSSPFKAEGAFFLRNMKDAIEIRNIATKSKSAIVVGAGLIGMEVAESLMKIGIKTKILEYMPNILPNMIDEDVADYFLKKINIDVKTNCMVKKVENGFVETKDSSYEADFVVVATGNKSNVDLCKKCKINKGIIVDEYCKVMDGVYAAGDCSQIKDFFGNYIQVGLGSIATRQGRIAGINAAGGNEKLILPLNIKTTKIFGIEIASVGLMEKDSKFYSKHFGNLLPEYMKGDKILIKLMADENGVLVGAQSIGRNASLYIDKIAIAIYKKMHVEELSWFETAYAPKVSPVFDAINVACHSLQLKMRRKNERNI